MAENRLRTTPQGRSDGRGTMAEMPCGPATRGGATVDAIITPSLAQNSELYIDTDNAITPYTVEMPDKDDIAYLTM